LIDNADDVNKHFVSISFDEHYLHPAKVPTACDYTDRYCRCWPNNVEAYEIEPMLRCLKTISPGSDGLPSWLFKKCLFELAGIVAHIYNCSFTSGAAPLQWLNAVVTPVPKVPRPANLSDYRPISVTPILSRFAETLVHT